MTKKTQSTKSSGGYWMLIGVFALLMAPIVVDHIMNPAVASSATVHADAGVPATTN